MGRWVGRWLTTLNNWRASIRYPERGVRVPENNLRPLIGASLDRDTQPRWKVSTMLEGMQAKIGNVDDGAGVFMLGADDMPTRNWGLCLAYLYTHVSVDATSSGFNRNLDWKTRAVQVHATLKF